jgi:hypothetical protein
MCVRIVDSHSGDAYAYAYAYAYGPCHKGLLRRDLGPRLVSLRLASPWLASDDDDDVLDRLSVLAIS